jgi:hypothetical protein
MLDIHTHKVFGIRGGTFFAKLIKAYSMGIKTNLMEKLIPE